MNWTDVVMVALTLASLGIALVALRHARNAAEGARGAVLEAKDANAIAKGANKIAEASNGIAERAAADAREAPAQVAWDEYVVAVAALQTFDAAGATRDAEPLMTALRTRALLLVDRLDWELFDQWLAAEHLRGAQLMREATEVGEATRKRLGRQLTPDESLEIDRHAHRWVSRLAGNVRLCRRVGIKDTPVRELIEAAWDDIEATAKRNGWPLRSRTVDGTQRADPATAGDAS